MNSQTLDRLKFDSPLVTRALAPIAAFGMSFVGGLYFWQAVDTYLMLSVGLLGVFALGRLPRFVGYMVFAGFFMGYTQPETQLASLALRSQASSGVIIWIVHGLLSSLPILLLRGKAAGLRAAFVFILFLIPPFGYLVPSNPALVAGILFPAMGITALILTGATVWSVAEIASKAGQIAIGVLVFISLAANWTWLNGGEPVAPLNWHGLNTSFGEIGGDVARRKEIANLQLPIVVAAAAAKNPDIASLYFLPEGMIFDKNSATDMVWGFLLKNTKATAVVGEYFRSLEDDSLYSGVRILGKSRQDTEGLSAARAGSPFPVVFWHPWNGKDHFPLHTPNPIQYVDGQRLHLSFCVESTILWPHLLAAQGHPTVFVTIENRWIITGTSLEHAQNASARLNARWLGSALLRSINY